ncbi:hypothetical protein [Streptomyces canus]|uniref:hypothetical protein n=1 Tax=Streptomyces canus TaxID=58343 RepID=UPI0036E75500
MRLCAVHAWRFPSCAAELPFGVPEEDRAAWADHEVRRPSDALMPWRERYPDVAVLEDVRHGRRPRSWSCSPRTPAW